MLDQDLTLEDVLNFEGFDYRESSGKSGTQLLVKECPSCGNDNNKVYINQEVSLGNCFACGKTYNLFSFVRAMLEGRGAASTNRDVGLYLNEMRRRIGYRPARKKVEVKVAVDQGDVVLPNNIPLVSMPANLPYMEKRGINQEWAGKFDLRFCNFGANVYRNEKNEEIKQDFSKRIIIPVYNLEGKLVTFQGRDATEKAEDRYKFAGGLPGTARYLYNGHTALALRSQHIVMCEGAFDVVKAQMALSNFSDTSSIVVVGSWGKHLSKAEKGDDQVGALMALKRVGLKTVTMMYDGEAKAFAEALAAAQLVVGLGLNARIAMLPPGLDPGDADSKIIREKFLQATEFSRLSFLRMKVINPYKQLSST